MNTKLTENVTNSLWCIAHSKSIYVPWKLINLVYIAIFILWNSEILPYYSHYICTVAPWCMWPLGPTPNKWAYCIWNYTKPIIMWCKYTIMQSIHPQSVASPISYQCATAKGLLVCLLNQAHWPKTNVHLVSWNCFYLRSYCKLICKFVCLFMCVCF